MKRGAVLAIAAALSALLLFSGCREQAAAASGLRVVSPGGAGGLLVECAAAKAGLSPVDVLPACDCYSNTAAWAFANDNIDCAVLCPDAAASLVEKDNRYTVVGPLVVNSDVIVLRDGAKTGKIGVAREYQAEIVEGLFGSNCETVRLSPAALPYAYENGAVDGVVVDGEQAFALTGVKLSAVSAANSIADYVLVARKDGGPGLTRFYQALSEAAVELNSADSLQKALTDYGAYPVNGNEAEEWINKGIRFVPLK